MREWYAERNCTSASTPMGQVSSPTAVQTAIKDDVTINKQILFIYIIQTTIFSIHVDLRNPCNSSNRQASDRADLLECGRQRVLAEMDHRCDMDDFQSNLFFHKVAIREMHIAQ
jgi:hypothetical protein